MMDQLAKAIMILAARLLGSPRGEWARAMEIECDIAVPEGRRLPFAIGCLVAACREVPRHHEGRISLAGHTLSLALFVPMAAILLMHAGRFGHSVNALG